MSSPRSISIIGGTLTGNHGAAAMVSSVALAALDDDASTTVNVFSYYPEQDARVVTISPLKVHSARPLDLVVRLVPQALLRRLLPRLWNVLPEGPTKLDVWLYALRERPIQPTIMLIRTTRGEAVYETAVDSGALTAETVAPRLALDGQARSAPHHHDTAARRSAGRLLGVRIRSDRRRARPMAFIDAFITVAGTRLTETARGRRLVALVPRPLIRVLLVVRKGIAVLVR